MKIYIKQVATCAECPHEMLALPFTGMCSMTGKTVDTTTLPDWCPLEDVKTTQLTTDCVDNETPE